MRSPTQKVSGFNGGWLYNGRARIRSQSFRTTVVSMLLVVSVSRTLRKTSIRKITNTPHEQRRWGEWRWCEVLAMEQSNGASPHVMHNVSWTCWSKTCQVLKNIFSTGGVATWCVVQRALSTWGDRLQLIHSPHALVRCLQSAWTLLNKILWFICFQWN